MTNYAPPTMPPQKAGQLGKVRGTGGCIALMIVTLGFYSWYWTYQVHADMQRHNGRGLGGPIALLIQIFFGIAMPYVTANQVGELYTVSGRQAPVGAATGLWYFPGIFILVGPIVWFVKTNGALNEYWRSQGAV